MQKKDPSSEKICQRKTVFYNWRIVGLLWKFPIQRLSENSTASKQMAKGSSAIWIEKRKGKISINFWA